MAMVEVEFEFIGNDEQYSFRVVYTKSRKLIFSPPKWYDSKEEAINAATRMEKSMLQDWQFGNARKLPNGHLKLQVPDKICEDSESLKVIVAVITQDDVTGQFGIAIYTDSGMLLLEPDKWFDTIKEVRTYMKEEDDILRKKVSKKVKELGLGNITFIDEIKEPQQKSCKLPYITTPGFDPSVN